MAQGLVDYNQNMNRVFSTCIDIQNTARSLDQTMFDMELLARNGVAQAAKLSAGHGRPLLVLAEILAGLPGDIRAEVKVLEGRCHRLTQNTASCSNTVRTYYQLIRSLLASYNKNENTELKELLDTKSYLHSADVDFLHQSILTDDTSALEVENLEHVSAMCRQNLEDVHKHLHDSTKVMKEIMSELDQLKSIGQTARYLAQHIEIEAAQVSGARESFTNLAMHIHGTIDQLESTMLKLRHTTESGVRQLNDLSRGVKV